MWADSKVSSALNPSGSARASSPSGIDGPDAAPVRTISPSTISSAAAELMQTSAAALDIVDGEIVRTGAASGPSMPLGELARALPDGLSAEDTFESAHMVYPYGVHV